MLDPNVIISGLLSPAGNAAQLLEAWGHGEFELIASNELLEELDRALRYPKLRRHISEEDARRVLRWLKESATVIDDPADPPPVRSVDPGDDYLIALAADREAILVSGDRDILDLAAQIPVLEPGRFLEHLAQHDPDYRE